MVKTLLKSVYSYWMGLQERCQKIKYLL